MTTTTPERPLDVEALRRLRALADTTKVSAVAMTVPELDAILAALAELEGLRKALRGGMARGQWEHAYDCGELGPELSTRACTCGLSALRAVLAAREAEEVSGG